MSENTKKQPSAESATPKAKYDNIFVLEDKFPDISVLLQSHVVETAKSAEVIVALDTNVLLVPYLFENDSLDKLADLYKGLAKSGRLFVPARALREFFSLRDQKLMEMIQALQDAKSKISTPQPKINPLLKGLDGYNDMCAASEIFQDGKKKYYDAQKKLITEIYNWSGNDPVTRLYGELFKATNISDITDDRPTLANEWAHRSAHDIPPGTQDTGKRDTGIGDFLIWKSLLRLGATHNKDMIFVTNEIKGDWFVKKDPQRSYPRPELIDEYRRHSEGRNIRLLSLTNFLEEVSDSVELLDDVRKAEISATSSINDQFNSDPYLKRLPIDAGEQLLSMDELPKYYELYVMLDRYQFMISNSPYKNVSLTNLFVVDTLYKVKGSKRGQSIPYQPGHVSGPVWADDGDVIVFSANGVFVSVKVEFWSVDGYGLPKQVKFTYAAFSSPDCLYAP